MTKPTSLTIPICLAMLAVWASIPIGQAEEPVISTGIRGEQGIIVHSARSEYQSGETQIRVLLPDKLDGEERHPVVYVLPVEAGRGTRWGDGLVEVDKSDLHNKYSAIFVAPTFSDLPWFADHAIDKGIRQESHFVRVVMPFIERTYPAKRDRNGRLLVGFSKSGWGAWSLLLRHPELFGRAAAWDAPLMMERPDMYGMGPIFGTQENFERYQLSRLLRQSSREFVSDCRLIHLGYGNFREHHRQAEALLNEMAISHVYRDGPARQHSWSSGWLPEAVELLFTRPD